jgi:hypothetical protein
MNPGATLSGAAALQLLQYSMTSRILPETSPTPATDAKPHSPIGPFPCFQPPRNGTSAKLFQVNTKSSVPIQLKSIAGTRLAYPAFQSCEPWLSMDIYLCPWLFKKLIPASQKSVDSIQCNKGKLLTSSKTAQ